MEDKFQDPIFGEIVWEEENEWWDGKVEIHPGLMIEVNLSGNQNQMIENINEFQAVFEYFRQNEAKARLYATDCLHELHNDTWRQEGEDEITEEEFCRRILPESIVIYEDKSAEIYYHDDNLFWGHVIIISMDEAGEFTDAQIAG